MTNCQSIPFLQLMLSRFSHVWWHPIWQSLWHPGQQLQRINVLNFRLLLMNHPLKASCSLVNLTFTNKNAIPTIALFSPHKSLPQSAQDDKNVSGWSLVVGSIPPSEWSLCMSLTLSFGRSKLTQDGWSLAVGSVPLSGPWLGAGGGHRCQTPPPTPTPAGITSGISEDFPRATQTCPRKSWLFWVGGFYPNLRFNFGIKAKKGFLE